MIGNLPIVGKEGGLYGEATQPGKYITYKYIFLFYKYIIYYLT